MLKDLNKIEETAYAGLSTIQIQSLGTLAGEIENKCIDRKRKEKGKISLAGVDAAIVQEYTDKLLALELPTITTREQALDFIQAPLDRAHKTLELDYERERAGAPAPRRADPGSIKPDRLRVTGLDDNEGKGKGRVPSFSRI
jgi:hypothetical protein